MARGKGPGSNLDLGMGREGPDTWWPGESWPTGALPRSLLEQPSCAQLKRDQTPGRAEKVLFQQVPACRSQPAPCALAVGVGMAAPPTPPTTGSARAVPSQPPLRSSWKIPALPLMLFPSPRRGRGGVGAGWGRHGLGSQGCLLGSGGCDRETARNGAGGGFS